MTMMMTSTAYKPTRSSKTTITQAFAGVPLAAQATIDTPIGPLTALATAEGLAGLWFDAQKHHPGDLDAPVDADHPHIAAARRWLEAYWAGKNPSPRDVALDLHGTPFQRAVWKALLAIPLGRTKSYGEIAAQVAQSGIAAVPRATGAAVGRNPVSILVPCHRVIGADGSLTGYAGGLPRKERLLQHEGVLLT
jgi:methylated-DNA-[protein]-cysteine S-methyltransferase